MPQPDPAPDTLSPYERATCYYTLPRINPPLHAGVVLVFGGILLAELIALTVVAVDGSRRATLGMVLLVLGTAVGATAYMMLRSLRSEIRVRRMLRDARLAPPVRTEDDSLPDPFAGHTLLRHPGNVQDRLMACTDHNCEIAYTLHAGGQAWNVRSAVDESEVSIRPVGGVGSFRFVPLQPKRLAVLRGDAEVARIYEAGGMLHPFTQIDLLTPAQRTYRVEDGGIYLQDRLVGRVYFVHEAWYLDIETPHLNDGTLGYFVSLV